MTDATVGLKTPWAWSNGRRIWVYEVTQELKEALTFKCPGCEQPVHYRSASGNGRRAHFVHTGSSGSGTGGGGACHGNGETDEHKIAKMWIADHIQHVSFRRQCPTCSSSATQTYAGATAHIERPMLCGKKPDVTVYDARDIEVATVEVEHTHATDASSRQAQWDTFGRDHVHEIHATDVLNHIYALWKAEQGAQQHIVLPEKRASCQSCQDAERKRQEEQKRSDAYWKACQQSASSSSSSSSSHKRIREQFEGKEEKKEENAAPKRAKSNEGLSFHKWKRRRVEPFDMDTTDLLMYVMDVEASSTFAALQNGTSLCKAQAVAERPTFWMHGVTDKGHSICAIVHDFYPYCYVRLPNGKVDLALFWRELEAFMKSVTQGPRFAKRIIGPRVLDVTLETDHNDLMYYRKGQDSVPFARITLCLPELIPMCRSQLLKNRFFNNTVGFSQTYESNVPFFLRLLINKKTAGCCWIKIPKGTYYHPKRMSSRAQIEVLVRHNDLQPLPYEGEYSHLGETRTLSFDIECKAKDKHFPKASESPIVLICASLKIRKSSGETSRELIGFGWPDSYGKIMNPPDGLPCTMFALADEERMLRAWKDFVLAADPDVFTGYNFINFDWPYIIERCEALGLRELAEFGRKLGAICEIKEKTQQSKAFGTQKSKQIVKMNGRINMDPLPLLIKSQTKYRSYKLNSMASALLDRRKDDVSHWQIPILHNGTDAQRAILARYCFQDALLADLMDEVEEWTVGLAEFDRIMGVTTEVRLSRGTQINGFTLLQSKASEKLYHVPHPPKIEVTNDKFVGAIVLEPVVGYYKEEPIATLDFNSLYPTIMAAFNLCYSTLLEEDERKRTPPDDYITSPDGKHAFIKPHLRRGLLADVQRFLLQERKRVKKQMAEEKDPIKKKTLNVHNFCPRFHFVLVQARQLQIKLGGNSLYGFTGARAGMLPCVAIAETVTAIGQVEQHFTKANGYEYNAKVVYGDTDSVMCNFGRVSGDRCNALAKEAEGLVNKWLQEQKLDPMKIEFEKRYENYLLLGKKQYAGLKYEPGKATGKKDDKGVASVRRNYCIFAGKLVDTALDLIVHGEVQKSEQHVMDQVSLLLQNKVDTSELIISCGLTKEDYKNKTPTTEIRDKLIKRGNVDPPRVGDRISYVVCKGHKKDKLFDRVEDPFFAIQNDIPIDLDYYLDNQIRNPIMQIFTVVLGSEKKAEHLLTGPHTRKRYVAPMPKTNGLSKFLLPLPTCLQCRVVLTKQTKANALCPTCETKRSEIVIHRRGEYQALHVKNCAIWDGCVTCTGSRELALLCQNNECDETFYKRMKSKRDVDEYGKALRRLDPSCMDLEW